MGDTTTSPASPPAETIVALLDGRLLAIGQQGVREGQRIFTLDSLERAELLPTAPETLALEVKKLGQIIFQVARRGDGLLALKALYALRPQLRPIGAPEEPTLPDLPADVALPGLSALPPVTPLPFQPPVASPPAPGPSVYTPYAPYAPGMVAPSFAPAAPLSGELGTFPKSFSELLGAIFAVYGKSFGALIRLALVAVFLPEALVGVIQAALFLVVGVNPFGPAVDTTTAILNQLGANVPVNGPTLPLAQAEVYNQLSLIVTVLSLLVNAWEVAVFTWAAREALYGRRFSLGAMLRQGWRSLLPTFGISLLADLIIFLALVPGIILLAAAGTTGLVAIQTIGVFIFTIGAIFSISLWVRLALAPSIAALRLGHSIRRSWRLTFGAWWRTFGIVLMFWLINLAATYLLGGVELASFFTDAAIVLPLAQLFLTPLTVLASVALLYDLRLRQEGAQTITREDEPTPPASVGA